MVRIVIQKGDNLIKLAKRYSTTLDKILRNNPQLSKRGLITGQELIIGEKPLIQKR